MTYKLTYFNVTSLGEPIRFLFSYGGIPFEDNRIPTSEDWPKLKPGTPYGQVPILEYKGKIAHQSMAIARYIAKQVKLTGKDDWEDLEIDATVDTLMDLRNKMVQVYREEDPKLKEERREVLLKETVPYYLTRFDAQAAKNNGYLAVGRLTWADMFTVAFIDHINMVLNEDLFAGYPNLIKLRDNVKELPSIKGWIAKRPKTTS